MVLVFETTIILLAGNVSIVVGHRKGGIMLANGTNSGGRNENNKQGKAVNDD